MRRGVALRSEGLLDQHRDAGLDAQQRVRRVLRRWRGNVDGIDALGIDSLGITTDGLGDICLPGE